MGRCIVREANKSDALPYSTHIIEIDAQNRIGVQFNRNGKRARVNRFVMDNSNLFAQMMDCLSGIAINNEIDTLVYCDSITDDALKMFRKYGFYEKSVDDPYNHYLYMDVG